MPDFHTHTPTVLFRKSHPYIKLLQKTKL